MRDVSRYSLRTKRSAIGRIVTVLAGATLTQVNAPGGCPDGLQTTLGIRHGPDAARRNQRC